MTTLDNNQSDAIGELINMAMGNAAARLQELTGNEVNMSVPSVKLISLEEYHQALGIEVDNDNLISVSEEFSGSFSGKAVLMFYFENSVNLIKGLMPGMAYENDLNEMEEEVLLEVGNILINSCISVFANMLNKELITSLPSYNKGTIQNILSESIDPDDEMKILLAEIDFKVESQEISGHMALNLTLPVLESILKDLYATLGLEAA